MFSVWRKLTGKQDGKQVFPSGVSPIREAMQKKYAKGIQYNMKIILKGDRNTGKSSLFKRLNGGSFSDEYLPTHEIQVSNVNWNYQGAADIVKVEVWDIVDKSEKKRTASDTLKITNDDEGVEEFHPEVTMSLDAEFMNVYQGTHGVILTMDITKVWTWQYVQRELEKIPHRIPVLVLGNFRDMGDNRVVQTDEILAHIQHFERPTGSAEIYFTESSMKDGFGLHFIYKFLNMPFLILQRETLLKQLESNALEIEEFRETLNISNHSENLDYTNFQEMLLKKEDPPISDNKSESDIAERNSPVPKVAETTPESTSSGLQPLPPLAKLDISGKNLPVATVSPTVHSVEIKKESKLQMCRKIVFGSNEAMKKDHDEQPDFDPTIDITMDFDAGELNAQFLKTKKEKKTDNVKIVHDSDDDEIDGNPMVANYEDLESDEDVKNLEHQFSNEGEFEDLSDDERHTLHEADVSIIEKIKSERRSSGTPRVSVIKDYNDLDIDINESSSISAPLDELMEDVITKIDSTDSKINQPTSLEETLIVSEEDVEDVVVITQELDVDDSWAIQHSDHEDDNKKQKQKSTSNHTDLPDAEPSSLSPTLDIEIDDLELFMQTQLQKPSKADVIPKIAAEVSLDTPLNDAIPDAPPSAAPKKKKKKKTNTEETQEKRKKKKASAADGEGGEKASRTKKTKGSSEETVKKTKSSSKTCNERKSTEGDIQLKSKKTRKKDNSMSELDSFYSGL